MKKLYTTLLLALLAILTFAQTPNISMTTTLSVGSQLSFSIRGNSASTPIQIDWGNGVKENYTIGDSDEAFGFPIKGSTIKIWGQGVEGLNIQSKELTAMEFYQAISFKTLLCKGNKLTTLNLSDCSALTLIECKQNLLSSLTLPSTTTLTYVDCSDNSLSFATLPIKQATWTTYIYSPQKEYKLPKTVYAVNEEIDLSNQLTINSNTTTYTWKTIGGTTLVNGVDYNVTGGKFTFLKTYSEGIYCEMTNATFPSLTLRTIGISIPALPAVAMTTTTSIGSTFSFTITATANNTPIQVDWGNGTLANFNISTIYSSISGILSGNTIKIYGVGISYLGLILKNLTALDISGATALTSLSCSFNQLTTLDVTKNTALTSLDCCWNQLTTLDVTKNTALTSLSCYWNQLTTLDVTKNTALTILSCYWNQLTTLDVTKNTALTSLSCSSNPLTTIDVTKNTALTSLYCYSNKLTSLDATKNTALTELYCSSNQLSTLDVSINTALSILDCSYNKLTSLDITKNTLLTNLYCDNNTLANLDITNNTALTRLDCGRSTLSYLDITKNIALTELYCAANNLTQLDVSKNTSLSKINCYENKLSSLVLNGISTITEVKCYSNKLAFNTLPLKQPSWSVYNYNPQAQLALPKKSYALNEEIDLSSQLTVNGNTTNYSWKTKGGKTLISGSDYTENSGKFNFTKGAVDSVYCEMKNASFPDLTLNTTAIKLPLPLDPNLSMTTLNSTSSSFSFIIRSAVSNTPAYVDWGDGTITYYNMNTINSNITGVLKGTTIKIFGEGIVYVDVMSKNLYSIDVSNCSSLKYFFCNENQLTSIDLSNNTSLLNLNCSYNKLTSLDVSKNILLWNLDCDNNTLTSLDVTKNTALTRLDCGRTSLSSLDITKNIALTELYCAANSLTQLDVSKNTSLSIINCYENKLASLVLNGIPTITELRCYSNKLTFNTLPIKQSLWTSYNYSPQAKITLDKKYYSLSETIDLRSQLTANGNTTNYIWKTKSGTTLTSGTDYSTIGGITTFIRVQSDSVYCQMTNATFPLLTLNTTNIKVTNPTSIGSDLEQATKVYPNPVSNLLWVESEELIRKVEIYTVLGAKVLEQDFINTQKVNINTTEFPRGLLIVKVYGANGVKEKKILKE